MKAIRIVNARLHNLKNISLEIPRNQMVAITGVSGSGKSTLAFDLIYEQGRRRYLQSIGMLADLAEEIGCEHITGLSPTIAVQQGIIRQSNPRSSVGTRSGIFTLLRVLFVYDGRHNCPACATIKQASETCPKCQTPSSGLQSGFFSYNSPLGMCLRCQGHGHLFELNMEKLLPAPETTMRQMLENACNASSFGYLLRGLFKAYADKPFRSAPEDVQRHLLYGIPVGNGRLSHNLFDHLRWRLLRGREVNDCLTYRDCPDCGGDRVSSEARHVTLFGFQIGQLSRMTLAELIPFFQTLVEDPSISPLGKNLGKDILRQIRILQDNGLSHLTLYRELPSLSGGELQRLFLASHIDAQMDSLIYVLDEPTVGLHEIEKQRLLGQLKYLQSQGNSVLLVEHDPHMIAAADHILDIGPLAGSGGGELVYQGDFTGLLQEPTSITGQYLSGHKTIPSRARIERGPHTPLLQLKNVWTNNLKGVDAAIPLGLLVGVAGVSGSGKSSLVMKTLVPLLQRGKNHRETNVDEQNGDEFEEDQTVFISGRLEGVEQIRGFSAVSQQPIGRHENSNPATYLKIWDPIRRLFASSPQAHDLVLTPGSFSFNADGACPTCSGSGKRRIWLGGAFFANQVCAECKGKRFREEVLRVQYRGKTILDVLDMPAVEAISFFSEESSIVRVLKVLVRSGMGYLPIGQPAPTLSGGEAQRVKLALEISRNRKGKILYILDEPTIGLSLYDTDRLLQLLDELVRNDNTVLVIEHDPVILTRCDWIIELGPGGGTEGGRLIAEGTPAGLGANPASIVGPYLHG